MKLDREFQRALLLRLREAYPDSVDLRDDPLSKHEHFHANAFYLAEYGLIENKSIRVDTFGVPPQVFSSQITARGLDFLEDDGGLGAILGSVTVKFDPNAVRALLEARIDESALPPPEKSRLKEKLGEFAGKAAEKAFWRLFDQLLKNPDALLSVLRSM